MALLAVSFLAGTLTVLAPCILPLLPVVVGSSAAGRSKLTPYIVVASVSLSIILFTLLLKVSSLFIMVPESFWTYLSGGLLIFLGFTFLFPALWERVPGMAKLSQRSNKLVGKGYQKKSFWGDILIGAALGPVFSSCSPTYFVILATVLPASFALGIVYLLAYTIGLAIMLICIALIGQRFADRLMRVADSRGALKKAVGIIFIILGLFIASGYEKKFEVWLLESGYVDSVRWEQQLLQRIGMEEDSGVRPYFEIASPAGFVNTDGITVGELIGEKIVLIDFMTYSCINCQRTFPYMTAWYERYKGQGLEIIGIHTPEFAFEKDITNVEAAMREFGITYPVVLDNDFATWRACGNRYWPRKYLVDIEGNIVYDHIGEGAYTETELKIRELLRERAAKLGLPAPDESLPLVADTRNEPRNVAQSPEVYFGSLRNELLVGGKRFVPGIQSFIAPDSFVLNALYLDGEWNIMPEHVESVSPDARIIFRYRAKDVFMVAGSPAGADVEILQDGKPVMSASGGDVRDGRIRVQDERLYKLIRNPEGEEHVLEIRVKSGTLEAFTFTFG
jgi:cytochrome c biogenesis protein CcdA/thiol-disulfide isomerase/thioredoxin